MTKAPINDDENPYLAAREHWDSLLGAADARTRTWRLYTFCFAALTAVVVLDDIYAHRGVKAVPYVVQVDKHGVIQYVGAASETGGPADQRVIEATLRTFINNVRTVTTDGDVLSKHLFSAYAYIAPNSAARPVISEFASGPNGLEARAARETASIDIETVLKQSDKTWQIGWTETIRDRKNGAKLGAKHYLALISVSVDPVAAASDEQRELNPLGIYITDLSWQSTL